jgi:hypothetical protein
MIALFDVAMNPEQIEGSILGKRVVTIDNFLDLWSSMPQLGV